MTTIPTPTTDASHDVILPGRQAEAGTCMISFRASADVIRLIDGVIQDMRITRTQAIELCITCACAHWQTAPLDKDDGGGDQ